MGNSCLQDNLKFLGARGSGIGFELAHFMLTSIGDGRSLREISSFEGQGGQPADHG